MEILATDPLAVSLKAAIQTGDLEKLRQLLNENPELATARFLNEKKALHTALHMAVDWPGHFPRCAEIIAALIQAGADPNAQVMDAGYHAETPLHGAASSDDVEALDALLDSGADIERGGAVFTDGAAMSDAVIFAQWNCAKQLLARGAKTTLTQAAALGLMDRVSAFFEAVPPPPEQIAAALWHGCRGGQQQIAAYLLDKGADRNWIGWDNMTPLDTAIKSGNQQLIDWMRQQGAKSARELHPGGPH